MMNEKNLAITMALVLGALILICALGYVYFENILTVTEITVVNGIETEKTMTGWEWLTGEK